MSKLEPCHPTLASLEVRVVQVPSKLLGSDFELGGTDKHCTSKQLPKPLGMHHLVRHDRARPYCFSHVDVLSGHRSGHKQGAWLELF